MKYSIFLLFFLFTAYYAQAQGCLPVSGSFSYTTGPDGATVGFVEDVTSCELGYIITWDFDDGSPAVTGSSPEHVYYEEGAYLVKMTVSRPAPCQSVSYTYSDWVNISFSYPGSIFAELTGPTLAAQCQNITYSVEVLGGVPPYRYDWDMGSAYCASNNCPISSCDPAANCTTGCCTIKQGNAVQTGQFVGTGLSTNTVTVTVTDAIGQYYIASVQTKVKDNVFPLEFFVNGTGCGNGGYAANTPVSFSADINPMSAFTLPISYTWVITSPTGSTQTFNDDGYAGSGGVLIHTFEAGGTYQVSLTVADEYGSMQANKSVVICGGIPPNNSNCFIDPPNVFVLESDPTAAISIQSMVSSTNNCPNPLTAEFTFEFPNCNYPLFRDTSKYSNLQLFINFSDPGGAWQTKTGGHQPWGKVNISSKVTYGNNSLCCNVPSAQKFYIKPSKLVINSLLVTGTCQDYIITADVSGGGWKWVNGQKKYKDEFKWEAYSTVTGELLTNVLLDIPGEPANGPRKKINPEFIKGFYANQYIELDVRVTAYDYASQQTTYSDMLMFDPFRLHLQPTYYRCPNAVSTFDKTNELATGGTENFTYQWSGGLTGENPQFTAPASGSVVYTVTVTEGNNCTLTASTVVTVRPLATLPPVNMQACATGGKKIIGPTLEALQGSGSFWFRWTASNPTHQSALNRDWILNPTISGLTGTATYFLQVTDKYGGCSATYTYNVTGVPNTMTLVLPPTVQTCYGTPTTLNVGVNNSRDLPPGYSAKWLYPNFPRNIPLNSTLSGGVIINEQAAHSAGTYPFSVTVTEAETGCQVSGTVNLTILDKWRYTGYKSNPATRFSVLGEAVPLWKDETQNSSIGDILSPNISSPLVTWSGPTPTILTMENNIPSSGTFQPSEEHPKLVMTVVDQSTGCSQKFASTHYILMRKKPVINIKLDNYVICSGSVEGKKIKVQFDPHIIGLPPTNMPLSVLLSCSNNVQPNYQNNLGGFIKLKLSGVSGIYEADLELKNMSPGRHLLSFTYSGLLNNQMWGYDNINATAEVMVVENQDYLPATVKCDFIPLHPDVINRESVSLFRDCPPLPIGPNYSKRGDVSASKFIWISNTNDASIEEFYSMPTSAKRGVHFYINQCLTEGLTNPPTEERTSITILPEEQPELALSIVPNPFQTEVNIQFAFEEKEAQAVDLELYDVTGRKIALLRQWTGLESGAYNETINMEAYSPGMYTYVLRLSNGKQISRQSIKI